MESALPAVADRLDVKVGFACNNRCRFCVQGRKRERYPRRSFDQVADFLKRHARSYRGVVFTGGEPCLHPDLLRLVAHARELGFESIQIQTNGRMLAYARLCRDLIAAGVSEFSPALHGHSAACHDYHTRSPGSFEQTVRGIRNLVNLGQKVVSNTVVTRSNFRHLPALAELLAGLGVAQLQFAFVHPVGTAGREALFDSVVPRLELVAPWLHRGLERAEQAGLRAMSEAVPYCFMVEYERFVGERIMPRTRILDAEGEIADYRAYRLEEGKAKGEPCSSCRLQGQCEGPWREYVERFGWGEFEAIS
ncbi:MAG: radical SAM protein [Deltaproteobacteria bacterium]|nr:radical SAM protein [Deltaproteobacteria bacterium]